MILFNRIKRRVTKRSHFLKNLPKHSVGAELGVFLADYSIDILKHVSPKKLFLVDPYYEAFEYYGEWANIYNGGQKLSTKEASKIAKSKIESFENAKLLISDDIDFLTNLEEDSLDWVYIDSSHEYEHTKKELDLCRLKVKPGGIISGHDFNNDPNHRHYGVTKALNEFCLINSLSIEKVDVHTQWLIINKK